MKTKIVMKNKLKYYLKGLVYTYLLTILVIFVLPTLFALVFTGGLMGVTVKGLLRNDLLPFASVFYLFVACYRVYEPFKFYIQNGISRRTVWKATIVVMAVCSLVMSLINFGYYYGVILPITGQADQTFYHTLFGNFFGVGGLGNMFGELIFEWLLLWLFAVIGIFMGSLAALVKKRTRRILWIVIPIALVVLFRFLVQYQDNMDLHWIEDFVKFAVGYTPHAALWNPLYPIGMLIILIIIGNVINYVIQQHLVLKNQ